MSHIKKLDAIAEKLAERTKNTTISGFIQNLMIVEELSKQGISIRYVPYVETELKVLRLNK